MRSGFCILHANRLEDLRTLLVDWLKRDPPAPLDDEVILVQNYGMAQWLKLALAEPEGHGIATALTPTLPARFLWDAYRVVLGEDQVPPESPFDRDALTWRLMRHLPGPLAGRIDADDALSRYRMAVRVADLFDQYQVYRADWLNDWLAGRDTAANIHAWQPALWRAVAADAGDAPGRATIHQAFIEALGAADTRPAGLPRRVSVFGISSLPAQFIEALAALGRHCQVLLLVNNPCARFWGDIIEDRELLGKIEQQRHAVAANRSNPLLASWGKQGRDYIGLLYGFDEPDRYADNFQQIDLFTDPLDDGPPSLLKRVQHSIHALNRTLDEDGHADLDDDRSLLFQTAHSRQREVEILHDHLLELFEHDAGLQPREVVVMCPEIEEYAPHIDAVFGQYGHEDPRYIPFAVADRRQRAEDPLLRALDWLLALPDQRIGLSEVLALLDVPAVRRRFGIHASELEQLQDWLAASGVRWGLDAGQRELLGLPGIYERNTWRAGLKRMLLGYASGDAGAWNGIEPLDEVGGLTAQVVGPLVELIDALEASWRALREPATPAVWAARLEDLLERFFLPTTTADRITLGRLEAALSDWTGHCEAAGLDEALPADIVRESWLAQVDTATRSLRFLYGQVNFCTLMPMRAIPFKAVCLLGMNDRAFPRIRTPQDFDLMAAHYRPGDRSRREDDRYQFLEAVMAAREHLYISWVGRNIRDNSERAMSMLVAQLRDFIGTDRAAARTIEHPLQPFSPRYFDAASPLTTYASEWQPHEVAPRAGVPGLERQLPGMPVRLEQLARFLRQPVDYFFRERLGVASPRELERVPDHEPFMLDPLAQFDIKRRLLETALAGLDPAVEGERLQRAQALPPGWAGETLLAEAQDAVRAVQAELQSHGLTRTESRLPVDLAREVDGVHIRVEDTLADLYQAADGRTVRVRVSPNALKGKHHRFCESWLAHLAGNATGHGLATCSIGTDGTFRFEPLDPETACAELDRLLGYWLEAHRAPLPVACKTAAAWVSAKEDRRDSVARDVYEGAYMRTGEVKDSLWLARQWPEFDALRAADGFERCASGLYGAMVARVDG